MKGYVAIALLALVCLPARAQQSNEDYYAEQRAIQDQQFANEMNRRAMEQAQDVADAQAAQAQAAAYAPPRYYGSAATDGATLSVASYYQDSGSSDAGAISTCERQAGPGKCRPLGWFSEQCASFARGLDGSIYPGYSPYDTLSAKEAMDACMAASEVGKCRLMSLPLCVGSRYRPGGIRLALDANASQLESWSRAFDTREYWGAIAVDKSQEFWHVVDYPSEATATRALVGSSDCPDCSLVKTFQNTCAGIASVRDASGLRHSALVFDADATVARDRAREQCSAEAGTTCKASVQCDGRAYIDDPLSGKKAN